MQRARTDGELQKRQNQKDKKSNGNTRSKNHEIRDEEFLQWIH